MKRCSSYWQEKEQKNRFTCRKYKTLKNIKGERVLRSNSAKIDSLKGVENK